MDESTGKAGVRKEHGGEGCLGCRETRGDLPVCFRCGKRRLPVDSIRASSGFYVRGERAKGEIVRVEVKVSET